MEHPKVAGLPDGAFRLWVMGLAYCQKFLTDGYISLVALRGLRAYSQKRTAELVKSTLWDEREDGVQVHDFLDWNDSRAHVTAARDAARERLRKHKEKRVANASVNAHLPVMCVSGSSQKERGVGKTTSDEVAERAGRFLERYAELYQQHRRGARYVSRPHLDFQEAVRLCQTWPDERLDKLATVFLTTDHQFAENGSRTIAQFRSMASWCDSRLCEAGIA